MQWGVITEEKLSFKGKSINIDTPYGVARLESTEDFAIARENVKASVYAFKKLGILRVIGIYPGRDLIDGTAKLVSARDMIDFSRGRSYTFFRNKPYGFIAQDPVFCPTLTAYLEEDIPIKEVLLIREGHWLESEAELKAFKGMGVDLIIRGASPEVYLTKELELCYLPLVSQGTISEETLLGFKEKDMGKTCSCQSHMDKARRAGLDDDWQSWIGDER